jgi:hypothetical protein
VATTAGSTVRAAGGVATGTEDGTAIAAEAETGTAGEVEIAIAAVVGIETGIGVVIGTTIEEVAPSGPSVLSGLHRPRWKVPPRPQRSVSCRRPASS